MYLVNNIIGLCSRTVYGIKGDQVIVLDDTRPLWLVENKGIKFFIKPEDVRIQNPDIDQKPLTEERLVYNKANSNKHKRNTRPAVPKTGQSSLFGD